MEIFGSARKHAMHEPVQRGENSSMNLSMIDPYILAKETGWTVRKAAAWMRRRFFNGRRTLIPVKDLQVMRTEVEKAFLEDFPKHISTKTLCSETIEKNNQKRRENIHKREIGNIDLREYFLRKSGARN